MTTVTRPPVAATIPLLATALDILHRGDLTPAQREARIGLAQRLDDFRHALGEAEKWAADSDLVRAARELLDTMAECDDADQRAERACPR